MSKPRPPIGVPPFDPGQRKFEPPLTIGLIADTHLFANGSTALPGQVISLFLRLKVGLILHAGDANDDSVLTQLAAIAPVVAVSGNNDDVDLRSRIRDFESIDVGSHRISLVHGHGGRSARLVAQQVSAGGTDVLVYGHSHIPRIEKYKRALLVNPGSPTDRRKSTHFGVGLLSCPGDAIEPELILFRDPAELDTIG